MQEILVKSSLDGKIEPNLFYKAKGKNRPLLIGLHTWSYDRNNLVEQLKPIAKLNDWNLLLPNFRGPNVIGNPQKEKTCGSKYAVQDVFDAITYVEENFDIDKNNKLVIGLSGGGQLGLLLIGKRPEAFRAGIVYVPICDLALWHDQNFNYYGEQMDELIGFSPKTNIEEYKSRSPITYAENLAKANLKICHGKFDTVVPFTQSVKLYEKINEIDSNSRVFLEVFDGKHQWELNKAIEWLKEQMENKQLDNVTG